MTMNATCPDTPDLLDHIEGRTDLGAHVVTCDLCSSALGELRAALSIESALVATAPLDVERALGTVIGRAKKNRAAQWRMTFFFAAAAAAMLVALLPSSIPMTDIGPGPEGGANGPAAAVQAPNFKVEAPNVPLNDQMRRIVNDVSFTSTAAIHS